MSKAKAEATEISDPTNGGEAAIKYSEPYTVRVGLLGTSDILFHRWDCDAVRIKEESSKGSKAKKTDDLESYVYRNDANELCIPGFYLRASIIGAARYRQDPRSPRKSAMDLYKAAIVALTHLASLGQVPWDYEYRARVQVQRNAVTRTRPAVKAGWRCEIDLLCHLPEYISPATLLETINAAGRLQGLADNRPTFGRFQVTRFDLL